MKKNTIKTITKTVGMICLLLAAGQFATTADAGQIGVIDFQRFLTEAELGRAAQAKIETEGLMMETELKQQANRIEEMKSEMERDAMVMSDTRREEKEREYRIKILDLQDLQERYKKRFQGLERRLISHIQTEAVSLAEELGKKEGFLLLIEKNAVVYHPAAIDATDKLIELSNARELTLEDVQNN